MTTNRITMPVAPDAVFAVLFDADEYARWVVGAKKIRGTDPNWPAEGSRFHHTVGAGPANIDDSSKILVADPPRRFQLEVRFRPGGVALVTIDVEPRPDGGSLVTMHEQPTSGPVRRWWSPILSAVMHVRNALSLRRLRRLAVARARRGG